MKTFINGFITGLVLQTALGPVFFYIINLTFQKSIFDGLIAVLAVFTVDCFYIFLSIIGISRFLEKKKIKKVFGIISSVILIIFGVILIRGSIIDNTMANTSISSLNLFSSFSTVFLLTISSPMTIIFYTSLFTAKAVEYHLSRRKLYIFGLATGLATLVFMGISVVLLSFIKGSIPLVLVFSLNLLVGFLLILYGIIRFRKIVSKH